MTAKGVPFECAPSAEFLGKRLKELCKDSDRIVFDHPHFQAQLKARGLSMRHALETAREWTTIEEPKKDKWGDWRVKVHRLVAGRRVQLVVAYKGDHFVVVTII
jgi:hypothetical protein